MTDTAVKELVAKIEAWADWLDFDLGTDRPAGDDVRKAASMLTTLSEERDEARREALDAEDAENQAKDLFWAIYPDWCKLKGHGLGTEAARTMLAERATAAEARVLELEKALDKIEDYLSSAIGAGTVDTRLPVYGTRSEYRDSLMVAIYEIARRARDTMEACQ